MDLPKRKPHRLTGYDYATCGAYFITCCTRKRRCLFWKREQDGTLSPWGILVEQTIREIPIRYPSIRLEQYAVMPNHVHLLLLLEEGSPSISTVINQMKGAATKLYEMSGIISKSGSISPPIPPAGWRIAFIRRRNCERRCVQRQHPGIGAFGRAMRAPTEKTERCTSHRHVLPACRF